MNSGNQPRKMHPSHSGRPVVSEEVLLAHGGGGRLTDDLLVHCVLPRLGNRVLNQLTDAATLPAFASGGDRIAMTIDSYVVSPWKFPGGDIGRVAICGTVNDLAVSGAQPMGIAMSLILTEGFRTADLEEALDSAARAAREAGVAVVTGDTKVVGRGQGDGIVITTAGVGRVPAGRHLSLERVQPGDVVLLSGAIGEHGLTVMLAREMPEVHSVLRSDVAPLNKLIELVTRATPDVVFMRDPTRSGLAGVASDIARQSGWHLTLDEDAIPVTAPARHAAEMLGLDPLEVANEGKVVIVVRPYDVDKALAAMHMHPLGRDACVVGRIEGIGDGVCELRTSIGGRRVIQKPYGEQLPRIC